MYVLAEIKYYFAVSPDHLVPFRDNFIELPYKLIKNID